MAVIDLNGIKSNIQSMLTAANTTTASHDLSLSLTARVVKVLKVNPSRIPIQSTWYPWVTCYIDNKQVTEKTIAVNQQTAHRAAEIEVVLVGAVWNTAVTSEDADDADDDCARLMENVEEIMRSDPTLGGKVKWCRLRGTSFHTLPIEEGSSLRAGMATYTAITYY